MKYYAVQANKLCRKPAKIGLQVKNGIFGYQIMRKREKLVMSTIRKTMLSRIVELF